MSSENWKLENDLCRCCHSEGSFKNLAEPFKITDVVEIYADMLKECYDIDMAPVPGMLSAATYTICDVCIMRLRDASDFKKQALSCEERFKDMYNRNVIKAVTSVQVEVKQETLDSEPDDEFKEELSQDDNDDDCDGSMDLKISEEDETPLQEEVRKKRKYKTRTTVKNATVKTKKKTKRKTLKQESADTENDAERKQDYATLTAPYYNLEDHEDGSKYYACTSCTRKYKSLPSVVQHYRHVHLRLRPKLRSCFFCEVKVPGHARAFHLEKEHGIPAPTCNACGKKFAYPFQVLRHQKNIHMGEKKFSCSECDMRFTSQANLSQHMIKHSGVRVHNCEICEKSFKWKKNLRTHMMMHMDERRHVCPVCQDAFVQQTSLRYHVTKRHPEYV